MSFNRRMKKCVWIAAALALASLPVMAQTSDAKEGFSKPPLWTIIRANGSTPTGTFPAQMVKAYGFDLISNKGAGQTIAIIDAFDDPNIEADLGVFDTQFGLPSCTTGNGCFQKLYAAGTAPATNAGWGQEISLDVEWAHAIAPQAKILLVEAATNANADLYTAVDVAVAHGASVVSMSFGGGETSSETSLDSHFNVAGVTFVASSGDSGHGAQYPAASPFVVGVGGTSLTIQADGTYVSESAWSGSGGGQSRYEAEPPYQNAVQSTGKRTIPDVSYDADPATGVPVYDSFANGSQVGWLQFGGTSMSAPQWSSLFAIANSSRAAVSKGTLSNVLNAIYTLSADLHDIASGTNGRCPKCKTGPGYDQVTGLGTPKANLLIPALVALP